MDELIESIVADLASDLYGEIGFSESRLRTKVQSATKEIIRARKYPVDYSDEDILEDINRFYSNIRNLALYDYNQIGAEFQSYSGEGAVFRNYTDRNKLFYGVTPFAVCS